MRATKVLVVCSVLAAGVASAQEQETTATTTTAADAGGGQWSVGAGAGVTVAGNDANNPGGFVPRASVEYLLSSDTALVLGGFGNFGVGWEGGGDSQVDGGIGATLGLRKYLVTTGANRLSLHGLFNVGFRDAEGSDSRLEAGLRGGFAVDHTLSQGLVLRAGVDVANFGFGRNLGTGPNAAENRIGLDFFLSPSLELRFVF